MTEEFMHEVQDDLRQQNLEAFWKENGPWIIGGVIAAVIFTAILSWWRTHEFEKNMAATSALISTMETDDPSKLENLASGADKNHALLARFTAAKLYTERHENDKAAAVYAEIATMGGIDSVWKDLARVYGVGARLDSGDPAALHKELDPLTKKKNAWRFTAKEMQAQVYAREHKMKEAEASLGEIIADPSSPPDMRARATALRELYLVDIAKGK